MTKKEIKELIEDKSNWYVVGGAGAVRILKHGRFCIYQVQIKTFCRYPEPGEYWQSMSPCGNQFYLTIEKEYVVTETFSKSQLIEYLYQGGNKAV